MWQAAQRAVDEANRQGGYQGKPFRLLPAWAKDPWGGGVKQLAHLVYVERVWAIISGVDGATAHLAEQVAAKARLPMINAVSTDKTVNLANVPWVFSLAPPDDLICPPLAAEIVDRSGKGHFCLVSANDHDSRQLSGQLAKALLPHRAAPSYRYEFHRGEHDLSKLASEIVGSEPTAVMVIGDADDSAALVVHLREQGFAGTILGGPAMGHRRFRERAGKAAEGAIFPRLTDPSAPGGTGRQGGDSEPYRDELGLPQASSASSIQSGTEFDLDDDTTVLSRDAVNLLVQSIRQAGMNRARIRDAVAGISPWQGDAGVVRWDRLGRNTRKVQLSVLGPLGAPPGFRTGRGDELAR
jgi:branched-chain amino acid transport system substrate-binding protein